MTEIVLRVAPASGAWRLACDLPLEPIYFTSAALAEQAARGLALRLNAIRYDVRLVVEHCDAAGAEATGCGGSVVVQQICFKAEGDAPVGVRDRDREPLRR